MTAKSERAPQAHRIRAARTRTGPGRAGGRRRAGREPDRRSAVGIAFSALTEAGNFLNAAYPRPNPAGGQGRTGKGAGESQAELDQLTQKIVAAGFASWSGGDGEDRKLIVRGARHLLDDLQAVEDLERVAAPVRRARNQARRHRPARAGPSTPNGARIFIGSENKLFSLSGSSTIVAPYRDGAGRIVGVLGVIGPTRLNYARVIPMVDYTAKVVSKLLGG